MDHGWPRCLFENLAMTRSPRLRLRRRSFAFYGPILTYETTNGYSQSNLKSGPKGPMGSQLQRFYGIYKCSERSSETFPFDLIWAKSLGQLVQEGYLTTVQELLHVHSFLACPQSRLNLTFQSKSTETKCIQVRWEVLALRTPLSLFRVHPISALIDCWYLLILVHLFHSWGRA